MEFTDKDFFVDRNNLDKACELQPRMMQYYSAEHAEVKTLVAKTKAQLEFIAADLEPAIRKDPEAFDAKATIEGIKAAVLRHPRYRDCQKKYWELLAEENELKGIVATLEHRRQSITDLIKLHGQGYFSSIDNV